MPCPRLRAHAGDTGAIGTLVRRSLLTLHIRTKSEPIIHSWEAMQLVPVPGRIGRSSPKYPTKPDSLSQSMSVSEPSGDSMDSSDGESSLSSDSDGLVIREDENGCKYVASGRLERLFLHLADENTGGSTCVDLSS
jgi:hypothetical protein